MQYSAFINGESVDLLPDTSPEFTRQTNDIGVLADVKADAIVGLDLPDTGNNRRLTRYAGLADNANGFERDFFRVDVLYDGIPLIDNGLGYIQEVDNGRIRINVTSGNANIFTIIQELQLRDLRFPELDHDYNVLTVTSNMYNTYTDGFIYPVIDYGRTTAPTVYDKVIRMYPDDDQNIFPAMFERYVFEAIFAAQGYTVQGDFLTDSLFMTSIIPYTNESFENIARAGIVNGTFDDSGSLFIGAGGAPITGVSTTVIAGSAYVVAADSVSTLFASCTFADTGFSTTIPPYYYFTPPYYVTASYAILVNSVVVASFPITNPPLTPTATTPTPIPLFIGDVIELAVVIEYSLPAAAGDRLNLTWNLEGCELRSDFVTARIIYGDTVFMEAQLPEMTQADYVKSVMHRFGLVVQTDNQSKVCTFYSLDEVSQKKFGVYDWTAKLTDVEPFVYSRKETRFENYGRTNVMAYGSDDTVTPPLLTNGRTFPYGSATFSLTDNTLKKFADVLSIAFAGTVDIAPTGVLNEWIAQILHWVETDTPGVYEAQELEPRCCYVTYKQGLNIAVDAGIIDPTIVEPDVAIANFNAPVSAKTLHFESLMPNFYPRFVSQILGDALKLEVWCYLNAIDVNNFDHRKPVFFAQLGAYFYVNQIQAFVGNDRPTKLYLTRV